MQGNIRKKGKKYYIRYYEYIDGIKKQREKAIGTSYDEAEKKLNEIIYKQNTGYISTNMSLKAYLNMWLEDYVKEERSERTYIIYRDTMLKHVIPCIGNVKLCDLRVVHVEKYLREVKKIQNNNSSTIQLNFRNLKTALNKAVKLQLLNDNPCRFVEMPKKNNFKGTYLTVQEFNLIYNSLNSKTYLGSSFQVLLDLAIETGCRRGEMCGTEWSNIDFENKTITFDKALIKSEIGWKIGKLKTETSYRDLPLSDNLINQLKKLRIHQLENKFVFGSLYHLNIFNDIKYDLICIQRNGKFMVPNDIRDRLRALLKRNKIDKNIRWHDLRHTSATLLLENGVAMKTIQKRLGHASMSTTADIYSHVTEKMDREATNIISRTIKQI